MTRENEGLSRNRCRENIQDVGESTQELNLTNFNNEDNQLSRMKILVPTGICMVFCRNKEHAYLKVNMLFGIFEQGNALTGHRYA